MNSADSAIKLNIQNKFERWGNGRCDDCPFRTECAHLKEGYICQIITGKTFGEMKESMLEKVGTRNLSTRTS